MLSIIVNFYNNRREAANTLHSLSRPYQRDSADIEYEVIALDNGSPEPLNEADVTRFGPEFGYRFVQTQSASPVQAINDACRSARGEHLIVMIDGAHIVTPGVLKLMNDALRLHHSVFAATVPFHLGPKAQNHSVLDGYNQQVEDDLLNKSNWKSNGYAIYTLTRAFADGSLGWFGSLLESGCFGISKTDYLKMGGFEEKFQSRGGGLVNLDFFRRAVANKDMRFVVLLGEATFHQVHGGVASNTPFAIHPWEEFNKEYERIRGRPYDRLPRMPLLYGTLPPEALPIAKYSAAQAIPIWQKFAKDSGSSPTVIEDWTPADP